MKIIPVPVLDDNYAYLLIDEHTNTAHAVDPAQAQKVIRAADQHGVQITKVLTTHKHWDHAGGNADMASALPNIEVVGGELDNVEACTTFVRDGDTFTLGNMSITCLHTPGHTMGHICYFVTEGDDKAVFTGDTLFVGGAGRFFEGSAQDMFPSLYEKLGRLPAETKVYCGHEYTLANYRFALSIDPENTALQSKDVWAKAQIQSGKPTVPSTIQEELATNPFMRATDPSIQEKTGKSNVVDCLGVVRQMKNSFRG
eukprot:CAMPEP_0113937152 /NCGR_PEP_ID=MMETSP1339-20121228/3843_1 /TAXON_ID=94617 /ORGANISM="Fibrocapsa japonica" /LENGTH=255 /DNA_ID=CAMNT_0000939819 /DNA_START=61 /DNA_END=828 /DNA_ORIENTATION=- /assembly_acc=CAM_ASM_000762